MNRQIHKNINDANSSSNYNIVAINSDFSFKCLIFSVLIAAMVYIFVLTGGDFISLMFAQGMVVLWVVYSIFINKGRFLFSAANGYILLVLAIVFYSNLVANHGNYEEVNNSLSFAVAHVFGIVFFIFAAQWAAYNLQLVKILRYISLILAPLILSALAIGLIDFEKSRAAPFALHPNWWGELAFGFILCSLVLSGFLLRSLFIVAGVGLMIIVQSRGALLATSISLCAYFFMCNRPVGLASIKRFFIIFSIFFFGLLFSLATGLLSEFIRIIESKVLLLNDPYRGVDSEMTGRFDAWMDAILIFIDNPIFGQGIDTLTEVHNGFLRWAAEGGILMLGLMTTLIITAMLWSWKKHHEWNFAVLIGVMAYMMTYPRALNLNLVGIVFFMALFSWQGVSARSVHRLFERP